ncbi:cyclic nucleotide-binding protein-like protein [Strigomonas culicis]|nr:cyclic nucleotide-binding protein-like protein [Strigomonas culicis]|eukprot:EPY33856.1 cyclic nucleotide-binding protein-like protein [Strigomonas culicis]
MMVRYLRLKKKRQEAEELVKQHLRDIPFPFPQVIQSMNGTFFTGWPPCLLEQLVANAKPMYLKKGSYLMHEGDIGRVMFMITRGEVSIILHKRGKNKRRTKENSNGVLQIKAPCYVGEFALVCKEPRSASIYCETDIGFWAVLPEDYEEVAKKLSPEVASKQREATDERRRQNLKRFFPLRVDFLRNLKYFESFSNAALTQLIELVEPLVLHDGDFLYKMGEMDSSVYFIQDGVAMEEDVTGEQVKVTTGSCIGIFECSCGVNERKRTTIVSINYCDIWRLRRETLIDIGMSEPHALLDCRAAAKANRAKAMQKSGRVMHLLKRNAFLTFTLLSSQIVKLFEACTPCVYLNDERIVWMGQPFTGLVIIVSGSVNITIAVNGEQEVIRYNKANEGDPGQSGHSALPSTIGSFTAPPASMVASPRFADHSGVEENPFTIIGAYEFAASFRQYGSTVTSFGLTQAYVIDKAKLDAIVTPELKRIMFDTVAARDLVVDAYKARDMSILRANMAAGFAQKFKIHRDSLKEKKKK